MNREPGHYWVRCDGIWTIEYWNGSFWMLPGRLDDFFDDDFSEIDERRIERDG